jgi:hypothetical protein
MSYKGVDRKFREWKSSEIVVQQTFHFLSEFNTQAIEHYLMKLLLRLLFVIPAITMISICFYELLIFLFVIALYCRRSHLKAYPIFVWFISKSFSIFSRHEILLYLCINLMKSFILWINALWVAIKAFNKH